VKDGGQTGSLRFYEELSARQAACQQPRAGLATERLVRDDLASRTAAQEVTIATGHVTGARPVAGKRSWYRPLNEWLANPLLVTVVAALLGGWLIPQITREWQNHEKALEIKTGLVSQMSESVSRAVMTSRFIAVGLVREASRDPNADQRAWNDGFREWTTNSASIGAKLEAYFGSDLGSDWRSFGNVVTDYFQLSANVQPSRPAQVREIFAYQELPKNLHLSAKDRRVLATSNSSPAFHRAYAELGRAILQRRDELVQSVLDAGVSGL
jgi:hypothetical protein